MKILKIYLCLLLLLLSISGKSQVNLDSLFGIWNDTTQADTVRLKAMSTIAWQGYIFTDTDSAFYFSQLRYDFAKARNIKNHMADALNTQGTAVYLKSNYYDALQYFQQSLNLHIEINNKAGISGACTNIGVIYKLLGDSKIALDYYTKGLKIQEELGYNEGIASSYVNIGILHEDQGNYDLALKYFNNGLNKFQEIDDKQGLAKSYSNIGGVYFYQKKFEEAIEFHQLSLKLDNELNNKNGIANSYINIGSIYHKQEKYKDALEYFNRSLDISNEIGSKNQAASSKLNIGLVFYDQMNYEDALTHFIKSLQLSKEINSLEIIKSSSEYIYKIYKKKGFDSKALVMYETYISSRDTLLKKEGVKELVELEIRREYELKKKVDSITHLNEILVNNAKLEASQKELIKEKIIVTGLIILSILTIVFLIILNNRFKNTKIQKSIIEEQKAILEIKNNELERLSIVASKTENVILILDSKGDVEWINEAFIKLNKLNLEELIAQRGRNISSISNSDKMQEILDLCKSTKEPYQYDSLNYVNDGSRVWESSTITPIFNKNERLSNYIIIDTDITKQKHAEELLSKKNKDLSDSINYAKRIQNAMMTTDEYIQEVIPNSFVFFNPKDVVSGDFYWVFKNQKGNIFFTVADCTGHGVPGAFMSMIGTSFLNENIIERGIEDTAEILTNIREQIIKSLKQEEGENKDGMDMALCKYDPKKKTVQYSGAYNPLIHISKNEINHVKGDNQPIALYTGNKLPFTSHEIKVKKGDMLYIYSDGFADQFGGERGRKYMSGKFKKFLLSISEMSTEQQEYLVKVEFTNWMGENEQIDDVCVMGVRIT